MRVDATGGKAIRAELICRVKVLVHVTQSMHMSADSLIENTLHNIIAPDTLDF